MDWSRVLVTGAGGFVGANLVHAARQRHLNITALLRPSSNAWRLHGEEDIIARGDVTDFEALSHLIRDVQPTVIIHSAVYGGYSTQQNVFQTAQTNYISILNLLVAVEKYVPNAIVLNLGSSSEYGYKSNQMRETDALEPTSVYGASKASASLLARAFALERGLSVFSLRLFSPYGAWESPTRLIPAALSHALTNRDFPMTSGNQGRDFIFIEDVTRIIFETNFSELIKGDVFNLGSGIETSVFDAANLAYQVTNSKAQVLRAAIPDRNNDSFHSRWQADISHARASLNWGSLTSLKAGFALMAQWLRDYDGDEYVFTD